MNRVTGHKGHVDVCPTQCNITATLYREIDLLDQAVFKNYSKTTREVCMLNNKIKHVSF